MTAKAVAKKKGSSLDDLKAKISNVVGSPKRAGEAVAKRARASESPAKSLPEPSPEKRSQPEPAEPSKKSAAKPAKKRVVERARISLHAGDLERLDVIEKALRKAGVPTRKLGLTFLIKVGIAGFDPESDLKNIVEMLKKQDARTV